MAPTADVGFSQQSLEIKLEFPMNIFEKIPKPDPGTPDPPPLPSKDPEPDVPEPDDEIRELVKPVQT